MRFTGSVKALLVSIQASIEDRVSATVATRPDWPCRAGCDHCCRHLAAIPEVTEPEWNLLSAGLLALPAGIQEGVIQRMQAIETSSYPFTCPLLDSSSGQCLVYQERPLACRIYGFYVERGEGLYCGQIHSLAESGQLQDVVWGNQVSVDEKSAPLGRKRSILEWFMRDETPILTND